jgi:hypothetical protein
MERVGTFWSFMEEFTRCLFSLGAPIRQ